MTERARAGYRGYIVSRSVRGTTYPQRVQNLVVRDFARRHGLALKLSITEYAMPDSTMMLEELLAELPALAGVILFSAFVLPVRAGRRTAIVRRVLDAGAVLCAALEDLTIRTPDHAAALDELIAVATTLPATPFGGRYAKSGEPLDATGVQLLLADA